MKSKNSYRLGFSLVELMVVVLVFSIVAYGIFNFFSSQSTNTILQSATSQVNREGQVITNFMRQELLGAKKWMAPCDRTTATFINVNDEQVTYRYDAANNVLLRNNVEMAPNVETVEFHYYRSSYDVRDSSHQAGTDNELKVPVSDCPAGTAAKDCPLSTNDIRSFEAKIVLTSAARVFQPGSRQSVIVSQNPITSANVNDGRIRRLFVVRAQSRNLYQVSNTSAVESGCGTVTLIAPTGMVSCDADNPAPIDIQAITKITVGGMATVTYEGSVSVSAIYKSNTDPAPESWCGNAACASRDPAGLPPASPQLDSNVITSNMRKANQGIKLTSPADRMGSQILVAATWQPPATDACENPPMIHAVNPITITIGSGAVAAMLTSGNAARTGEMLGAVSSAPIYSCGITGGCKGASGTVKAQLLDKCHNPLATSPLPAVRFTIDRSAAPGQEFGSFDGNNPNVKTITITGATNGVYSAQVFSANQAPPGGVIPIIAQVVGNPGIAGRIEVPVKVCDMPKELVVVNPSSLKLPETSRPAIKACPGRAESIYVQVRNACGDAITTSSNESASPGNPANWTVSLDSNLSEAAEARQIGTLGPLSGGLVTPQLTGNSFKIDYMTGGTGLDDSTITTAYCGAARTDIPINIKFKPLPEAYGNKKVALTLAECPPLSVQLDISTPNPETGAVAHGCAGPSGPGSEDLCMEIGNSTPTVKMDEFLLKATVLSCKKASGADISLQNAGVLFTVTNPNDPNIFPSFVEADSSGNYLAIFPSTYTNTVGEKTAHLNSGALTVVGAAPLASKIVLKAIACFPGNNGVLDTTPASSTCSGDDVPHESDPVDFWVGPSDAGFMNKTSTGETFVKGRVGLFSSSAYDAASQLWPESMPDDYPYGPVIQMPTATEDREIYFEVRDGDENENTASVDAIMLNVKPSYSDPNESETVVLTETGPNTGIFRGMLPITLSKGYPHAGKLDVAPGDQIAVTYTDNDDASDTIISRFYMTGCRSITAMDSNLAPVNIVSPSVVAADNIDSSASPDVLLRHAFHLELVMPEKAYFTGNATEGETLKVGMRAGMTDLHDLNSTETFTMVESSFGGGIDNSGVFHIDPAAYASRNYIYVSDDPGKRTPCDDPAGEICMALDDTPSLMEIGYGAVDNPDCSVQVSVADIDRPRVTLEKVSMGGYNGAALSNGSRVSGTVYMSGTADDGNGFIPLDGVMVSVDAGITFTFSGTYNDVTKRWQLAVDTLMAPDGIYTIKIRAQDSAGNRGYSDDAPLAGLGTITLIIDNVSNNIDLYDYGYDICGDHKFTVDTSAFIPWPDSAKTVSFYVGGDTVPVATVPVDENGLAQVTLNVDTWTALREDTVLLRAVATDRNTPQTVLSDTSSYNLNKAALGMSYTTSYISGGSPLQGVVDATIIVNSCRGVSQLQAQTYLTGNPLARSGFITGIFNSCIITTPEGVCQKSLWHAYINTAPSDCAASSGYSPDGMNALHIKAVDASGNTAYSDTICINRGWPTIQCEPAFAVDNVPVVAKTLPVSSIVSGSGQLQMRVTDCDGVPNDNLKATIVTPQGVTLPPINIPYESGAAQNALFGQPVNTNDFPACALYWRDGIYNYTISADDNAPEVPCSPSPSAPNHCGQYFGNVTVRNPPANVAMTLVNGATPISGSTKSGTLTIQARAEDCDFQAGRGSVKLYVDGVARADFILSATPGVFNYPSPGFNTKSLIIGNHVFTVVANDGNGNIVTSAGITFYIDNKPSCMEIAPLAPAVRYTKVNAGASGAYTKWDVTINGVVQNSFSFAEIVGQEITVTDTNSGGGSMTATTTTGGVYSVTFHYLKKDMPINIIYSINPVIPGACGSCANCPVTVTVP